MSNSTLARMGKKGFGVKSEEIAARSSAFAAGASFSVKGKCTSDEGAEEVEGEG
jgi:hypothetical protein